VRNGEGGIGESWGRDRVSLIVGVEERAGRVVAVLVFAGELGWTGVTWRGKRGDKRREKAVEKWLARQDERDEGGQRERSSSSFDARGESKRKDSPETEAGDT